MGGCSPGIEHGLDTIQRLALAKQTRSRIATSVRLWILSLIILPLQGAGHVAGWIKYTPWEVQKPLMPKF